MNKNDLEKKLSDIFIEIAKKETSFQRANDLFEKAQELGDNAIKEEITNETREAMAKIFVMFIGKNRDFAEKWIDGKVIPSDSQLNLLESNCEEILEYIDKINQKVPQVVDNDYCSNTKEGVKKLKQKVQQEKRNRKNKGNKGSTNQQDKSENPIQNIQQNEQIQKLQKEIELLTQQLFELQKQTGEILELLKKSQDSNEPAKKQEIQQKLVEVQTKQQQVQNQLEQKKQTQQEILANKNQEPKETESNSQTQTQNDKFNWLWVVVPMGGVIILLLGIIIFRFWKKNQK